MQDAKKSPKIRHLHTIAQLCQTISSQLWHVLTIGKKLVKQQYLLHMSLQYGALWLTNVQDLLASLGHPSKFQQLSRLGFVTAPTSLNKGQPNFAQCLAVSCTVYYICIFGGSCPLTELCQLKNSLCAQLLRSPKLAPLLHSTRTLSSAKVYSVVQRMELRNFHRGRHLYLAGRPLRWASAHILVMMFVLVLIFVPVQLFWMANCTIIVTCAWQVSYVMLRNHCSVCQHNFSTSCGWIFIKCGLWLHVGVGNSSLDFEYGRFNIRNSASPFLPWVRNC